ncbi:ATP-binding protein [Streptomyces sp. NPDC048269]|uniref:sensor histidine kinase n=1 Tax=Streptomyces sp. NPDC048269 TaxID=3155753 RepID=UPI00341B145C
MDSSSAPVFAEALYEGLVRATRAPGAPRGARSSSRLHKPMGAVRLAAPPPVTPTDALLRAEAVAILHRFTLELPSLGRPGQPDDPHRDASCLAYARRVLQLAEAAGSPSPEEPGPVGGAEQPAGGCAPQYLVAAGTLLLECALLQVTETGTADSRDRMERGMAVVRRLGHVMRAMEFGLWNGDPGWSERRRLGRWLHDELGNALAVALHRIELGEDDPGRAAPHLAVARKALGEAARENRILIGALRRSSHTPPVGEALQRWLADMEPRATVTVKVTGDETLASELCRRELFLVLREALRNCLTHAGAERIEVTVRTTRRWLYARVQDDGVGFVAERDLRETSDGHGLRSMEGRIEDLGGRLHIGSEPGEGTCVEIHLPLSIRL